MVKNNAFASKNWQLVYKDENKNENKKEKNKVKTAQIPPFLGQNVKQQNLIFL